MVTACSAAAGLKGPQQVNVLPSASKPAAATTPPQALFTLFPPVSMKQGNTPDTTKLTNTGASSTAKPQATSSSPQAPINMPILGGPASAKPYSSSAADQGKEAALGLNKDHALPEDSSADAGTKLPASTAPDTAADGATGTPGVASTISAPLSGHLEPPLPTTSSFTLPFSTPPSSAAPAAPASTSDAGVSQSSATPHSGTGFSAPLGFQAAPAFGTPGSAIPKPFAFGASQQTPGAASSPNIFGTKTQAPSFGSPQSFDGSGQPPQLTSPAPPDSTAAVSTSSLQPAPQPFTLGSGLASAPGSNAPALGSTQFAFGSSPAIFGSSQAAFGSSQFSFGSSQSAPSFGQPPFGSGEPAFKSGFAFASSQPAAAGFGASQASSSSPAPALFGQATSQPSLFGSTPPASTSGAVCTLSMPISLKGRHNTCGTTGTMASQQCRSTQWLMP